MAKKPSHSSLSGEDEELWSRVASTAEPLQRKRDRVHPAQSKPAPPKPPAPQRKAAKPPRRAAAPSRPRENTPPALATFETRAARRLTTGAIEIEGRVDLHGMRQSEAHQRLKNFLASSQAKGRKYVLVITGKGRSPREDEGFWERSDRGVLRRLVPQWLAEPEFRALVVSYTFAQPRHGGEGALYVRLRKAR